MTEPPLEPASARPSGPSPELSRVAFHAVASGLAPLIPVPLLDDLALRRVRERMVRDLLEEHGLRAPDPAVRTLAGSQFRLNLGGRVLGVLRTLVLYPVKKLFRKIFFVLWVKDCVDMASASLHHGFLLQHALARGDLDEESLRGDAPRRVYAAIEAACEEVDPRPVNEALGRIFSSSRLAFSEAMRAFKSRGSVSPRTPDEAENEEVRSLADRLLAELGQERGYFAALTRGYDEAMARRAAR